ncbi:hypothetical protein HYO14_22440 [Vibrio parahaemolyticus]|nr:hypothetical protein [Vibrio parahaemolyticus]
MKEDKIKSVRFTVTINVLTVVILAWAVVYALDLSFPDLDKDFKRKLSQAGTFINIIAALFLSYKFIQSERYNNRELFIYKKDEALENSFQLAKHNIHDKNSLDRLENNLADEREALYTELNNIIALDKLDKIHVLMGLICVVIGSAFQIVGAG